MPHRNPTSPRSGPPPQGPHFSGGRSSRRPPGQQQERSLHYLRARRKAQVTMTPEPHLPVPRHPQERGAADQAAAAGPAEERKTMPGPRRPERSAGLLDAGPLGADVASFRLHLAAEGKSARTVQGYTVRGALVRRRLPPRPGRKDQLGAGGRPRYPAVDGAPAGPVQQRVCQHPVPGAAAVLQVARRRGRAPPTR